LRHQTTDKVQKHNSFNAWSYTSTPSIRLHGVVLIKHKDKFTFTFTLNLSVFRNCGFGRMNSDEGNAIPLLDRWLHAAHLSTPFQTHYHYDMCLDGASYREESYISYQSNNVV